MRQLVWRATAAATVAALFTVPSSPVIADGMHTGTMNMPGAAGSGFPGALPQIDQLVPQGIPSAPSGAAASGSAASLSLPTGVGSWNPGAYVDPATGQSYASYDAYANSLQDGAGRSLDNKAGYFAGKRGYQPSAPAASPYRNDPSIYSPPAAPPSFDNKAGYFAGKGRY